MRCFNLIGISQQVGLVFTIQVPLYHEIFHCQVLSAEDCRKAVWIEELSGMFLSLPEFSQRHSSSLLVKLLCLELR